MIVLDTSVLIDSFTGPKNSQPALLRLLMHGELVVLPSLALYEWLRGPRTGSEIAAQENVFPAGEELAFGRPEAALAAILYRSVARARSREIDIAIAACAIRNQAELWTLNTEDFADIPGLSLWRPPY